MLESVKKSRFNPFSRRRNGSDGPKVRGDVERNREKARHSNSSVEDSLGFSLDGTASEEADRTQMNESLKHGAVDEILRRGGPFGSRASHQNLEMFIENATALITSDDDVATHVENVFLALEMGFTVEAEHRGFLDKLARWCKSAKKRLGDDKALCSELDRLRVPLESAALTLQSEPRTVFAADCGAIPTYKTEIELRGDSSGFRLKNRTPLFQKDVIFKIKGYKSATSGELVQFLRDAVEGKDPEFGPVKQFRLCAWLMRKHAFSGEEAFQVLAHAVAAMRSYQGWAWASSDFHHAKTLFKQCRALHSAGEFGDCSKPAAAWLYELGQHTAILGHDKGLKLGGLMSGTRT